jgi:AraC-like DNA-binding protein
LERVLNVDELLAAPIGKYLVGPTWLYFYPTADVSGLVLWGRLTGESLESAAQILPSVHAQASKRHVSLIDGSRVESAETSAFPIAERYIRTHAPALGAVITSLAVVYPRGLLATIAAGFFQVVEPPYPSKTFAELEAACTWLGIDRGLDLAARLDAIYAEATGVPPLLRDLRHTLASRLRDAGITDVCRAIGMSERSLQRRLAEHGTSFQKELARARVHAAEELLGSTDASLTEIAFTIGCASLPHFSALFRKATGESPSAWRAKHKTRS